MKNLFKILMCSAVFFLAAACSKDSTGDDSSTTGGGITYKSCSDTEEVSAEAQNVTVTITSEGAWSAKSSATRIASIKEGTESGEAGTHDIILEFTANTTDFNRNVTLSVTVGGKTITLCRFTQLSESLKGTDANVNKNYTTPILDEYYLWNEDFRELKLDYNQAYDDFVNNTLSSMTTNILDGHWENGKREYIYSYIERSQVGSASASLADVTRAKTTVTGFGMSLANTIFSVDNQGHYCFQVDYVYKDSPAEKAGVKRGDYVGKFEGAEITESNYYEAYVYMMSYLPVGTTKRIQMVETDGSYPNPEITLTAESYYENPVLYYNIFSSETSSKKVGYLVYASFDSAYDDEVKKVFEVFKEKGITDIILDLRLNGGGHVPSSLMISSALAGADGNDQVFVYYRYNDERMDAIKDCNKDDYKTYKNDKFDSSVASAYGFSFDKIYVIGTVNTASASELIINSLRGIGKTVKLVGETTNGKNVGMEVKQFKPGDGYSYVFAPISFQSYNAKGESDYANGFTPDIDASKYVDNRFQWGVIYEPSDQEGYIIPDMLYFALNDIFPSTSASLHSLKLAEPTRSSLDTRKISLPRELVNPLRNNMIKPLDETMAE